MISFWFTEKKVDLQQDEISCLKVNHHIFNLKENAQFAKVFKHIRAFLEIIFLSKSITNAGNPRRVHPKNWFN